MPGKECPNCGTVVPSESLFCMDCGYKLKTEKKDIDESPDEYDLENRTLCPDGTCTGIIINGRCTECGQPPR
jgi:uncharacterized OB-fold protein